MSIYLSGTSLRWKPRSIFFFTHKDHWIIKSGYSRVPLSVFNVFCLLASEEGSSYRGVAGIRLKRGQRASKYTHAPQSRVVINAIFSVTA